MRFTPAALAVCENFRQEGKLPRSTYLVNANMLGTVRGVVLKRKANSAWEAHLGRGPEYEPVGTFRTRRDAAAAVLQG